MRNTMRLPVRRALPIAAAALMSAIGLAWPSTASAADCASLPKPVYVAGSSAVKPFLAEVAKTLVSATAPITIVYQGQGSCTGVNYVTSSTVGSITGTGVVWNAAGTEGTCDLTAVEGNLVDIGVSDVYASSCGYTLPANVHDFYGPIQTMTFAVPATSTQTSISIEAAYMVFGFGADTTSHTISPWNDPTQIQKRNASSGTQQMLSAALAQVGSGFTAAKMQGVENAKSSAVTTALSAAAAANNQEKAIGILAMDLIDSGTNRSSYKPLALQFKGQTCGYTPDSTLIAWDKQNVRDGHYAVWGPLHMLTPVGTDGKSPKAEVQTIIDMLSGVPIQKLIEVEARNGVVPDCAMRVSRTSEVGPMASYMPPKSCECAFLAVNAAQPASCKKCDAAGPDCPACNLGYCEVR